MTELVVVIVVIWILVLGLYLYLGRDRGSVCGFCQAEISGGAYRDIWTKTPYCSLQCAVQDGSGTVVYERLDPGGEDD